MDVNLAKLIEQSIELELNVADLYMYFYEIFAEDKSFWRTLSLEEQHHADLLRSGANLLDNGSFPEEIIFTNLKVLEDTNFAIKQKMEDYLKDAPDRQQAFNFAYNLEEGAGEAHFQQQMIGNSDNPYVKLFQKLNNVDVDHALRIKKYMQDNNIPLVRSS